MIKEIYLRDETDPYYDPTMIDFANEVEDVITQIKMVLGTDPGQVLGDYEFGVDLDYMVFGTRKNAEQVTEQIRKQIQSYVKHGPNISIDCQTNFGKDWKGRDYAIVDIYINGSKSIGFLVDKDL